MTTSTRSFNAGLYLEHLEEASFLFEQRLAYASDREVKWTDLQSLEDRLEAHIDGLFVGGTHALDVCRQRIAEGDAGELYAALRVFCRHALADDVRSVIASHDPSDRARDKAIAHALCLEAPTNWRGFLHGMFRGEPAAVGALGYVLGYRRFPYEEDLVAKLTAKPEFGRPELAWALGRVGSPAAISVLRSLLSSNEDGPCEAAAAVALLRLGDTACLTYALSVAHQHTWARHALGIAGDGRAVRVLLQFVERGDADVATITSLGLLGDLSAVAPLLGLLRQDELKATAADALNLITGAQLFEQSFNPEAIELDALTDEERSAYEKTGVAPQRFGEPFGNWEFHAATDAGVWATWLDQHKHRFHRDARWQMGRPFAPAALLLGLSDERTPAGIRSSLYESLVARYGLKVPFEADLPVVHQRRFLARIDEWARQEEHSFQEGRWYLSRDLQD